MRVVVAVKPTPGGGVNSQATRYIAYRDRDEEREGKEPRQLFSARENHLSFWKAERALTEGRTPTKKELLHLAISFHSEDFEALGKDESSRQQSLREVMREALPKLAETLNAKQLRWVAGIHRNTDNPHLHLLIHREFSDITTNEIKTLDHLPKEVLPGRVNDENGHSQVLPGILSLAFSNALDRQQEKARTLEKELPTSRSFESTAQNPQPPSLEDRLLEIAQRNPSLGGRALTQEIILRSVTFASDTRPQVTNLRAAFQTPNLAETGYRTPTEQSDWLGQESQNLRDLYERGATVKGDTLIIPAEEHELPADRDQPFITSLSFALGKIESREQAQEFHTLAKMIAGETADARSEIEVFRYYYTQLRQGDREKTFSEMRILADEMAKLETLHSVESLASEVSLELEPERESSSSFNVAAHTINLRQDTFQFPSELSAETKEQLVTNTLPAIDRQLERGRNRTELFNAIDLTMWEGKISRTAEEQEERIYTGRFLKNYVDERLNDPETRALNHSLSFRLAHQQIIAVKTPEELSRIAEIILRDNLARTNEIRNLNSNEKVNEQSPLPPLTSRERNLLFYGRAPEHHTAEMRELRYAWGLSRAERALRVQSLHEGRSESSPSLSRLMTELETRTTLPAIRHYQASLLNEKMENPGKLDLHQLHQQLPPHERSYLIERIQNQNQFLTRTEPAMTKESERETTTRNFGAIPRESNSYREYMANMGTIERELLTTALQQRRDLPVVIPKGEELQLSITEARALLPREERDQIRNQARNLAWEQIAPPLQPETQKISDSLARLQEETQERARTAHQTLQEFVKEKIGEKSEPQLEPSVVQQWQELNRFAATTREDLYRGFESLDALRREYELTRSESSPQALDAEMVQDSHVNLSSEERVLGNATLTFEPALLVNARDAQNTKTTESRSANSGQRTGYIDSAEHWYFDSLREVVEPTPYKTEPTEYNHDREVSLER
jgi:MobL relaxases